MAEKRKKTTRKKTESTRVKKSEPLTDADLAYFQKLLLVKRRELAGDVRDMRDEALKKSRMDAAGDLSSMPIHMADIGTDNFEQEFTLDLMDSEKKLLHQIDDALMRVEDRTYGICEGTGNPIGRARLEAQPWAKYCVEYARMIEKGIVPSYQGSSSDSGHNGDEDEDKQENET